MIRTLIGIIAASAAVTAYAQDAAPLNPSTPAGRLAVAGGAAPGTKVTTPAGPAVAKPTGPAPAAKVPEHLSTAVTTKAVGKEKSGIKCADGTRVKPSANACAGRRGVDTATLAAEAQPGEVTNAPSGSAPITNALPSGQLKTP